MKKILFFLSLIIITNFLAFALAPGASALISDEIGEEIRNQLAPIERVYDPQGGITPRSLSESIARIIKAVLGLLGIIFLALIVYAGFIWMTAGGNTERIDKAKKIMSAAVIGTTIILVAYMITVFVFDALIEATITE